MSKLSSRNTVAEEPGDIQRLLRIMAQLRDPQNGCPWDLQQDFSTIAPYTIEEAYEVADAIQQGDMGELRDELGDLLLQVVFHSQMAHEDGHFTFTDVVMSISEKMERRHPHVFAGVSVESAEHQSAAWEQVKAEERAQRGHTSLMDDVPRGMAELQRSIKLQKRAAQVGFDWQSPEPVFEKLSEEIDEVREALAENDTNAIEDEIGDVLFAVSNLARQLGVDPAKALRRANAKFESRFRQMEEASDGSHALAQMSLEEMEACWQKVKSSE